MARLTPLSKGLIGLAVIGAMASAVWNLALKDRLATPSSSSSAATAANPTNANTPVAPVPASPTAVPAAPSEPAAATASNDRGLSTAEHAEMGRKLIESQDFAQARGHLELAVKGGDAGAACHLGEMTLKGQGGIAADRDAAARLFQLAQSRNAICFAPGQ